MGVTIRKFRLVNPNRPARKRKATTTSSTRAKRRKRNPVHLVTLGFTNPQKGTSMKKRKKNPAPARKRRKNPISLSGVFGKKKSKGTRRRRRNPEMMSKATGLMKNGSAALVGLVAARQIPQMILGAKNTGIMGYVATILAAWAASFAVKKAAGQDAGNAALIGGSMQLASRLLNEYVSPVGKVLSLSGVGDPVAAGLGEIRQGYFPLPVATQANSLTPIIPSALKALPAPAASAAAQTMSGARRSGSRFASRY